MNCTSGIVWLGFSFFCVCVEWRRFGTVERKADERLVLVRPPPPTCHDIRQVVESIMSLSSVIDKVREDGTHRIESDHL